MINEKNCNNLFITYINEFVSSTLYIFILTVFVILCNIKHHCDYDLSKNQRFRKPVFEQHLQ